MQTGTITLDLLPISETDFNDTKRVMSTQQKEDYLFRWRPMLLFSDKQKAYDFERYLKTGSGHAVMYKRLV